MSQSSDEALAPALAWLATLDPIDRARVLAALTDTRNLPKLAAVRHAAVHEATRGRPVQEVADDLGVSRQAVYNTVSAHLRAERAGQAEGVDQAGGAAVSAPRTGTSTPMG